MAKSLLGTGLPHELTSFIGRRQEIADVKRVLEQGRLVSIVGPGGVGKTRLAMRVVRERHRAFPDGVWWCELAPTRDRQQLMDLLADKLRVSASTAAELAGLMRSWTALIVLDNCEHLADDCADLVATLLRGCPGLRVLTTSRQRLGVVGESSFALHPLPVPDLSAASPDRTAAVTLFLDRAERIKPDLDSDRNLATIGQICRRLDGLPLAIELAAAWVPVLTPATILSRLDEPLGLLNRASTVDYASRHRTLAESIEWSYDLCTTQERRLWRYLSVFVAGCDLDAVEFVGEHLGFGSEETLFVLEGLVRKSVLTHRDEAGIDWFAMLVALRDFAGAMLDTESERPAASELMLAYYLDVFQRVYTDWYSPRQAQWVARAGRDLPNVRQALEFALTAGDRPDAVFGITGPGFRVQFLATSRMDELRRWLARALEQTTVDDEARIFAGITHAYAIGVVSGPDAAQTHFDEVRPRAEQLGNDGLIALVDALRASVSTDLSDAIAPYEVLLRATAGDPRLHVVTGIPVKLAVLYDRYGYPDRATALADQITATSASTGESHELAYLTLGLGANALDRGDLDTAVEAARRFLTFRADVPPTVQLAQAIETIAAAAQRRGEPGYAAILLGIADTVWHAQGRDDVPSPFVVPDTEATRAAARAELGEAQFDQLHARGRTMAPDDGLRYAMDSRGVTGHAAQTGKRRSRSVVAVDAAITEREMEIARLVANGLTDREIAGRLVISIRTAQGHVQRALMKLGLTSRTQLALWVAEHAEPEVAG